jgi:hypothetical protein
MQAVLTYPPEDCVCHLVPGTVFHGCGAEGIVVEMVDRSKLAGVIVVLDGHPLAESGSL